MKIHGPAQYRARATCRIYQAFWFGLIALLPSAAPAFGAAAVPNCPLARAPYSSRLPVADILIDPAAREILKRIAPEVLEPFSETGRYGPYPTFGRITTPEKLLSFVPDSASRTAALDAALKPLRVTSRAAQARCARYDTVPPELPATKPGQPAILMFDKITGFRDAPSVGAAQSALERIAQTRGWSLVRTDNGAVFNFRDLQRFDVVVWNNISGDALTVEQRAAFRGWMERGGGFAGIHGAAGDPVYFWDWYIDTLIGARFLEHTGNPQFQAARVVVDDPKNWIVRGIGPDWTMTEEWYSFRNNPRASGAHVLATLDEKTYAPVSRRGENLRMGDHPIAWTRCVGNGRSFYTAIGHRPESYLEAHSAILLERGIAWAMGLGDTQCPASHHDSPAAMGGRGNPAFANRANGSVEAKVPGL
jgi:type 1 glutamine amidotransferase